MEISGINIIGNAVLAAPAVPATSTTPAIPAVGFTPATGNGIVGNNNVKI